MQARKRSFFEEFTVAFAKPALWEKCRELSRILPLASPNELHVAFPQICGDVFGYGAGGMSNFSMGTISGMGFAQAQVHTVHSTSADIPLFFIFQGGTTTANEQ